MMRVSVLAIAISVALGGAADADHLQQQEPGCWDLYEAGDVLGNTPSYYNAAMSQNWLQSLQLADGPLMIELAGTYYGEIPAPQLGMVSRQYRTFHPNGLFEYQDQTCSGTGCSDNFGHGRWTARPERDGSIFMMVSFSDVLRTNACAGFQFRRQGTTLLGVDGIPWQRMR